MKDKLTLEFNDITKYFEGESKLVDMDQDLERSDRERLYGLMKQARFGTNVLEAPQWNDHQNRYNWYAWTRQQCYT